MKKAYKIIAIILIFVCVISFVCGCKEKDDNEETGVLIEDFSESEDNNKETTIEFWFPTDVEDICKEYVGKYEKLHSNISIKTQIMPWDEYWEELESSISVGRGPDIFWMNPAYQDGLRKHMSPLSDSNFSKEELQENFRNYNAYEIEDKLYYLPLAFTAPIGIYNKDIWKDAGLTTDDLPKTWEELETVGRKLTKESIEGGLTASGFDLNGSNNFLTLLTIMNYQSGELQYSIDGKQTNFYNKTVMQNMEYLRAYTHVNGISVYSTIPNRDALGYGRTAMICDFTWVYLFLKEEYPETNIGIFSVPTLENAPCENFMYADVSPCISRYASESAKQASEEFLKYLLDGDDFIKEYSLNHALYPSKYSLEDDSDIKNHPVLSVLAKNIDKTILTVHASETIESIKTHYLQTEFMDGKISSNDATLQTDIECKSALSEFDFDSLERYYKYIFKFEELKEKLLT